MKGPTKGLSAKSRFVAGKFVAGKVDEGVAYCIEAFLR